MELYANHIFLGANAYGVEAGAETYFGKQAKDLTLGEAALLAGVPKAPSEYSPLNNPVRAKERRDLVLDLMAKNGFATQAEVDAAKAKPIQLADTAYYQSQIKSTPLITRSKTSDRNSKTSTRRASRRAGLLFTPPSMSRRKRKPMKLFAKDCAATIARTAVGVRATR